MINRFGALERLIISVGVAFGLQVGIVAQASANLVTETFSGHIVQVNDPAGSSNQLSSSIQVNQSFTGVFKYDSSWPGIDMTPYCGSPTCNYQLYFDTQHQQQVMELNIGSSKYIAGGGSGSNGQIGYGSYSLNFFGLSGASVGSLTPSYATFGVNGATSAGSFSWPGDGFTFSSFANPSIALTFYLPGCDANGNCYFAATGQIDRLSASVAPEPDTYALLLSGLGLLGFVARRKQANT